VDLGCGRRIAAAAHDTGELPVAAHAGIVTQLDRLLTVMARYARNGVQPAGAEPPAPVPAREELTGLGIRITLKQPAASMCQAARVPGIGASTGHPVTGHLRAATDYLLAGRDLLNTHHAGASGQRTDPLWAPVLTARPVTAALMRELSGYALHLWYLTARLSRPAADTPIPPTAQEAIWDTARWLAYASSPGTSEHDQAGLDAGRLLLYGIPANLPPPRSPAAASAATAAELTAGVAATAARLRHLPLRPGQDPRWPPASAAACWRHNALAAAIIGHNGELILRALTDRARQLAVRQHHHASLRLSAGTMRAAWQSWQAVTHAWDPLTAGTSRQLPPTAAELDDLVRWIGRLARGSTWTPARSNACPPRPPAGLAPVPADVAAVAAAVALATDAITLLARHDRRSAAHAGLAGLIYGQAAPRKRRPDAHLPLSPCLRGPARRAPRRLRPRHHHDRPGRYEHRRRAHGHRRTRRTPRARAITASQPSGAPTPAGQQVGCLLLSGLRILIGSSPERKVTSGREEQEILS
jgi:hypothetical protein